MGSFAKEKGRRMIDDGRWRSEQAGWKKKDNHGPSILGQVRGRGGDGHGDGMGKPSSCMFCAPGPTEQWMEWHGDESSRSRSSNK